MGSPSLTLVWTALPLLAGSDLRFAQLRGTAEPVVGLGGFLERYVGD